jgi:uncharacterized SAM-binding protein YcdF (DUF218 family)
MLYLTKHWIAALISPLTASLLIVAIAVACRLSRRPGLARTLFIAAAVVGYVGSISVVGDALLGPLEHRYPPLRQDLPLPAAAYVVVLGSGYAPHHGVPVTAALDADGLVRVVEAVTLVRRLTDARLVVSGGAPPGQSAPAVGYAEIARDLGISEASLLVLDRALDTREEARAIAALVGNAPFILVTSAYHTPRAVQELRLAGVRPIPAPTGQLVSGSNRANWRAWLPNSSGLHKVERALHEYIGLALLAVHPG